MKGPLRFRRREAPIRCGFARTYVPGRIRRHDWPDPDRWDHTQPVSPSAIEHPSSPTCGKAHKTRETTGCVTPNSTCADTPLMGPSVRSRALAYLTKKRVPEPVSAPLAV